ncbi:MAG: hypothetical protein H0T76_17050 [Nannocystis sp.]|nr:hypothetical protein [Nannocystis sp.]MBA3548192.1 hypothetical protein [Nannocystis sp.]
MVSPARATLLLLCSAAAACGEDGQSSASGSDSATAITTATPTTGTSGAPVPTTGATDGLLTTGSNSESASESGSSDSASTTGGGLKLDLGVPDGELACGCEFNYVWVANASQGTVSKINMETLVEEGRYLTRADSKGNPLSIPS